MHGHTDISSLTDDEEGYEETGENRLLGFMFGNVDDSRDLDVDYLDEVFLSCLLFVRIPEVMLACITCLFVGYGVSYKN